MSAARAAIRLSPGVCLGVSPFLRRPKCFSMSGKKLPVLKGFRTCIDNKKSLLHLPGQSRSRGHPSVKFSLRPARPLSLLGLLSALRLPQARPQRRFVSFFTSRLQTLRRIHFFDVRRRILFFTTPAAAARPTLINKKNFPLCKSCRFLRAISPIFLLICALGKCCTTSA